MDGPCQADVKCRDNSDGSVDVTYLPTVAGQYAVHVLCDDEDIAGSPFIANIHPSPDTGRFDPYQV